jgi:hypothetical protein
MAFGLCVVGVVLSAWLALPAPPSAKLDRSGG